MKTHTKASVNKQVNNTHHHLYSTCLHYYFRHWILIY